LETKTSIVVPKNFMEFAETVMAPLGLVDEEGAVFR
jgi:hypothetical protein